MKPNRDHGSFDSAYDHFHENHYPDRHYHGNEAPAHAQYDGHLAYEMQMWRGRSASNSQYQEHEEFNEHDRLFPEPQRELAPSREGRWETEVKTTQATDLQDNKAEIQAENIRRLKIGEEQPRNSLTADSYNEGKACSKGSNRVEEKVR